MAHAGFGVAICGARIAESRFKDGELVWDGRNALFDGNWTVHVWGENYEVRSLQLNLIADRRERVALRRAGRIRVELDVPQGASALGRPVRVLDERGEILMRPSSPTSAIMLNYYVINPSYCLITPTEFDGTTEIEGLAPGAYQLECCGAITPVTIEAGVTTVVRMRTAYY
jgi:hypothetical protein